MPSAATRLKSFQSPRVTIVLLLLGLAMQGTARHRISAAATVQARTVAALDSAIAAATPASGDASADALERLRRLVSRKRDAELAGDDAAWPWIFVSMFGGALVLSAVIIGAQALIARLRGEDDDEVASATR